MATRTVSISGGNYSSTSTWVEGTVPTSSDDVVFTSSSGNLIIDIASVGKTFNCTNYTGILSGSAQLTISGSVTLSSGMTNSYTGTLIINSTSTITSNGKTFAGNIAFTPAFTYTFADAAIVTRDMLFVSNGTATLNGYTLTIGGSLNSLGISVGTTELIFNGTGTIGSYVYIGNNLTINTASTITLGDIRYATNTFKVIAGTLTQTAGTFLNIYSSCSLDLSTATIQSLATIGNVTVTLLSNLNLSEHLITSPSCTLTLNGFSCYINKNLTLSSQVSGSTNLIFTGSNASTWSGNISVFSNLEIAKTAGATFTISGTVIYRAGLFKYTTGSVTATESTLNITASCTLNTNGISFNNITIGTGTITINSLLTLTGILDVGSTGTVTFAGTSGFTCHTFSCTTAGRTINFATGKTYSVTNNLTITGSVGNRVSFVSTSTGALFNLQAGASQSVTNCNAIWVDSSGGQTIYSNPSTLTNTINWSSSNRFIPWFNSQF